MVRPREGKTFMGVRPDQVADLLALKGDAVDNIPGAPGIGDKGAKDLIERFGSVDAMLERAAEVEKKTYRESLQNNVERIRMSKRLATIATDVPVEFSIEAVKAQAADPVLLKAIYKEMEFNSLLKELGPSEDTRERQYRVIAAATNCRVAGGGAGRARGGGDLEIGRGRVRARHHRSFLACRRSARRACGAFRGARAVARRCHRGEDRLRREIGHARAGAAGNRGARFRARRHALRLPARCRCLGMPLGRAGAAPSRPEARGGAGAARRHHARALPTAFAGHRCARPAEALRRHRTAADARAGAHGAHRHPHRSRRVEAPLRARWRPRSRGSPRRSTRSPAGHSTSARRSSWAACCSRS